MGNFCPVETIEPKLLFSFVAIFQNFSGGIKACIRTYVEMTTGMHSATQIFLN